MITSTPMICASIFFFFSFQILNYWKGLLHLQPGPLRSQSLDRCMAPTTKMQCLTTASKNWLRLRQRLCTGKERMRLQGIDMEKHKCALEETANSSLVFLSGNAINFFNMAQGLVALFAVVQVEWFGHAE